MRLNVFTLTWRRRGLRTGVLIAMVILASGTSPGGPWTSASADPALPPHRLIVTEKDGQNYTARGGYPLQFGRVFAEGQIADEPELLVGSGSPVALQQASVKTRWPDGSAKFVIICARLPLTSHQSVTVTFRNKPAGATGGLTPPQMIAMDFDARISLTSGGVTKVASARDMLLNGHFTTWFAGPVATSVVLADHSASRMYDIGFTAYRPVRPIFHATFWPGWGVQVRAIGEMANTEEGQDVIADTAISIGSAAPATLVSERNVTHLPNTRWSRSGWIGSTPGAVNIDADLPYLAAVGAVPNFDPALTVSESQISAFYTGYQALPKGLYAQTNSTSWHNPMSDVGGRPELGPYPSWFMTWLYTGDWRMREYALFLADQYGSLVDAHYREGTDRPFVGNTPGRGRVLSIVGRPTVCTAFATRPTMSDTTSADQLTYLAPYTKGGVIGYDGEHVPHPFPIAYLLTGDFFYLEQLWFAASTELSAPLWAFRGPDGTAGSYYWVSPRSVATQGVARFEAAYFSPDGTPEQDYFRRKSSDSLKVLEGLQRIAGGPYHTDPLYLWASTFAFANDYVGLYRFSRATSPLGWFGSGFTGFETGRIDSSSTWAAISPWMQGYVVLTLGRAADLGWDVSRLLSLFARPFIDMVVHGPQPTHIGSYQYPLMRSPDKSFFQSWADSEAGFTSPNRGPIAINTTDLGHSYFLIAMAAASQGTNVSGWSQAWTWYQTNVYEPAKRNGFNGEHAKWAILPRSSVDAGPSRDARPATPRNLRKAGSQP